MFRRVATSSEVVREALREWKQRRIMTGQGPLNLQKLWADGLLSGSGKFKNMAAIKAEARRRLSEDLGYVTSYKLTAYAEDDLIEIGTYIAQDNPTAADFNLIELKRCLFG